MDGTYGSECYACMVGVATGPESHSPGCVARNIPMPEQSGQWDGNEWAVYKHEVKKAKAVAWDDFVKLTESRDRPGAAPTAGGFDDEPPF